MKHFRKYAMRKKLEINDVSHIIKSYSLLSINGIYEPGVDDEGGKISVPAREGSFYKEI